MRLNDKNSAALLALLVVFSFLACLFFLFNSVLLQGVDAAYYLQGIESIQNTGFLPSGLLQYPPVFLYAAALFGIIFGTVEGIKIAAAFFFSLAAFSVFLLAKQLFKNNQAALVAALFVAISPASMRLLNGFWKTTTAVFFLPLFFYFFLRAGTDKKNRNKNLALALAMLLLVFLSHKYVTLLALLVLLAFVVFRLVFEKKPSADTKNFLFVSAIAAIVFLLAFLASSNGLQELLGLFGAINALESASANASLWQYFNLIVITAFFGAMYCFFSAKREHLFLLSWFVAALFVALPLSSGSNYWRFSFLLAVPFALLSGLFFTELKKILGTFNAAIVLLAIVVLVLPQTFNAAIQIEPIYSEKELAELQQLKRFSSNSVVFAKGALLQWLQYYNANAVDAPNNFLLASMQYWTEGKKAFVALDKQRAMLDYNPEQEKYFGYFATALNTGRFLLLAPDKNLSIPAFDFSLPAVSATQPRFGNPVLWLFFPAELFNILQLPFASVLRALIGLPLSFALIALILLLLKKKQDSKNFKFAAFVIVAFLLFLIAMAK